MKTLNTLNRKLKIIALTLLFLLNSNKNSSAVGWQTAAGIAITAAAGALVVADPFAFPVAEEMCGYQAFLIGTDNACIAASPFPSTTAPLLNTFFQKDLQPSFLATPKPNTINLHNAMYGGSYVPVLTPLPGNSLDNFITASNNLKVNFATLMNDEAASAPFAQLKSDLNNLRTAALSFASEYHSLRPNDSMSQAKYDAFKNDVIANGLPAVEVTALQNLGLTSGEISNFQTYIINTTINFSSSVSVYDMMLSAANSFQMQYATCLPISFTKGISGCFGGCFSGPGTCINSPWNPWNTGGWPNSSTVGGAIAYMDDLHQLNVVFQQPTAVAAGGGTIPISCDFFVGHPLSNALGYDSVAIHSATYNVDFTDYPQFGKVTFNTVAAGPTLPQWALIIFGVALLTVSVVHLRRKRLV